MANLVYSIVIQPINMIIEKEPAYAVQSMILDSFDAKSFCLGGKKWQKYKCGYNAPTKDPRSH